MTQRKQNSVLFLGTGGDGRSRSAEALFNTVAGKMGLPWRASARELARDGDLPGAAPLSAADLEGANRIVGVAQAELLPLLQELFPAWVEKVEWWSVDNTSEAPARIEREIMGLVARILGGGTRPEPIAEPAPPSPPPPRKPLTAKVGRETAGRRGKGVTTVFDLALDEEGLRELAGTLKQKCGTGGTVKDGRIEIQGDQRARIVAELEQMGYKVKRVGG